MTPPVTAPATPPVRPVPGDYLLPSRQAALPADRDLFDRLLRSFVPPNVFDAHAHLYSLAAGGFDADAVAPSDRSVGLAEYRRATSSWMGDRCPADGLFFGSPSPNVDTAAANDFLAGDLSSHPGSRGLMLVRPDASPADVEADLRRHRFAGFKVYHSFARTRPDTFNAKIEEYLPDWIWDLADRHSLVITLHLVRSRALADEANQSSLRRNLKRCPNARLILAHAARGFCAHHTIEGVGSLAGFDNVYFDTSAICEPGPFLAILQQFGPSRLLYGSDFPVSNLRGRAISLADTFFWLHDNPALTLVGIESLLALKQAIQFAGLRDSEIEAVFHDNARALLNA